MIANRTIEKEDCLGTQNTKDGAVVTANFTPGGRWKTVKIRRSKSPQEVYDFTNQQRR